ncbi:biotin synthase [Vibrio galatheae]|uniref:Malonyl-[acyl-carrier protein] O-methyltransferase n=1 Tax=Vibrio galatheae TaxID=579748 RepID=A0A0F4NJD0_9VIBR|nr:malonyl-ACP O-methyltransferase BioC [Vibrio galatheae]KJY83207.1 biotin synthase [Vibrio galatheae]
MNQAVQLETREGVDKSAVANAFSRAAATYDQHAAFQRDVGHRLLDMMPADLSGKTVLDLGCGTGYFSAELLKRGALVVCCDLSAQMLAAAKSRCGNQRVLYQQGDAECLPFDNHQFDYVFSSLALQWCDDLSVPLKEIKRVVKAKGSAYFSTLIDGSLYELKQAWRKIDSHQHVNEFVSINQINIALAQSDCQSHQLDLAPIKVWYQTAFALMRDLKGIGATHVNGRSTGLTSRRSLLKVEHEYLTFRNHQGLLPATYQVCLGVINL